MQTDRTGTYSLLAQVHSALAEHTAAPGGMLGAAVVEVVALVRNTAASVPVVALAVGKLAARVAQQLGIQDEVVEHEGELVLGFVASHSQGPEPVAPVRADASEAAVALQGMVGSADIQELLATAPDFVAAGMRLVGALVGMVVVLGCLVWVKYYVPPVQLG